MSRNLKLVIGRDYDVEQPDSGYDGWRLISFGRKHNNYEAPDKYVRAFDQDTREVTAASIGLRSGGAGPNTRPRKSQYDFPLHKPDPGRSGCCC